MKVSSSRRTNIPLSSNLLSSNHFYTSWTSGAPSIERAAVTKHERVTTATHSDTSRCMQNAGLSRTTDAHGAQTHRNKLLSATAMVLLVFGSANCDGCSGSKESSSTPETAPSSLQVRPQQLKILAAQPPQLKEPAVLAPPALAPELEPNRNTPTAASAATPAPSASAATNPSTTPANTKGTTDSPSLRPDTQTPGPMAPRPHTAPAASM